MVSKSSNTCSYQIWLVQSTSRMYQARAFAFDPRDPDRIYAGVEEGGILLSLDGGKTWRDSSAGLTWSAKSRTPKADVHSLTIDPHDPSILHGALGSGYHISRDGGERWEQRMEGMPLEYTRAIAADRTRPGRLLVGTSEYPPVWMEVSENAPQIAPAGARLFETLDHGMHWRQVTGGFPERNEQVNVFLVPGDHGGVVLLHGVRSIIGEDQGSMYPIKVIVHCGERVARDIEAKQIPEFCTKRLRQSKARITKCGSNKDETFFAVQRFKVLDQGWHRVISTWLRNGSATRARPFQ